MQLLYYFKVLYTTFANTKVFQQPPKVLTKISTLLNLFSFGSRKLQEAFCLDCMGKKVSLIRYEDAPIIVILYGITLL